MGEPGFSDPVPVYVNYYTLIFSSICGTMSNAEKISIAHCNELSQTTW